MKPIMLFIASSILLTTAAWSQKGATDGSKYGHGEDSVKCLVNTSLYVENYKQKNYKEAFPYWEQVFNDCPLSSPNIYTNGTVIIKALLDQEKDKTKQEELLNYLMSVYDQRIKYFGTSKKYPTSYILGIKAIDILNYKSQDIEARKTANTLFIQSVDGSGLQSIPIVLQTYMSNTVVLYTAKQVPSELVVNTYITTIKIIESQLADQTLDKEEIAEKEAIKANIIKLFTTSGAADCETIQNLFEPKLPENLTNIAWLKTVNNLLIQQKCENNFLLKVSETLHTLEPSASSAHGMATMYLKNQEPTKAIDYYIQAIDLEENIDTKGIYNYNLGLIYSGQKNYSSARTYFQKAIECRPTWGDPHIQIGILYGASSKNCGYNEFENKTVYWVAVDKFIKAKTIDPSIANKANEQIGIYSAYFPSKEELFFRSFTEGTPYKVNCWINETTTIRAKK